MANDVSLVPDLTKPEVNQDSSTFEVGTKMQLKPVGVSGTELFAGYFSEEYLQLLRGKKGAKVWDEMRRSEAQVAMLLSAISNPIKAATWEFEAAADVPDGEKHKELMEYCAKEMIDWETHLHEALTLLPFGFSVFEVINNVVFNHPKFGTFNGLKALAFRSQKTIERWNVDRSTGDLQTVTQWVQGDLVLNRAAMIDMPAQFLLVFTLQKEGDNYEGISVLRPMYGPWFRKNLYLKVAAIGIEKNAIGTPIGTIPAGKQDQTQIEAFKEFLSNFTAHESAYLMKPDGWGLEIVKSDFDATKVKDMILLENTEMINSVVANFLALGMNGGGGAFALGSDLSDFFLSGIQTYANIVAGIWNRKLIPNLVKLNFGEQPSYPKLKVSGINDKAGKELSDILKNFIDGGVIKSDDKLETFLRKAYNLPVADPTTSRAKPTPPAAPGLGGAPAPTPNPQLSEKRIQLAEGWKSQWKEDKADLKQVMQEGLEELVENYIDQIRRLYKQSTAATRGAVGLKLEPKLTPYVQSLREALAEIANRSLIGARKDTPKAKNVKLSESIQLAAPQGGFFEALPPKVKRLVQNQASLIANTQSADIEKVVSFQYASSQASTDNIEQIVLDIEEAVGPVVEGSTASGMSVDAAAGNAVSSISNQARMEWFFEPEVLDTIESFTFYNEDPVSEICQELDGTTWAVNDPDLDRYSPPLHHNCKSRLIPNEKDAEGNPEIDRGGTAISQKGLDSITLCEGHYHLQLDDVQWITVNGGHVPLKGGTPAPSKGRAGKKSQGSKAKSDPASKAAPAKASEPSADEARAIRYYTGSQSSDFIAADRGQAHGELAKEHNELLNNYLAKAPKFEGNLHRGIVVEKADAQSVLDKYKPGSEIAVDAKQSWTTDPKNTETLMAQRSKDVSKPVSIKFEYPNSKVGVDISKHSRFEEEKEVLVPKGTKYKVKSVEPHGDGYKVTFE